MLSDTTIKRLNSLGDIVKQGKRVNGLMRLMENPVIWKQAYANIASNKGVVTKGSDDITLDGFSKERIDAIIESIKKGTYSFKPVRRTYISKKNGKKRPLGIPNGNDKLVQEVCRIILEQIYEKSFSPKSHGFRSEHSCHTALSQVHDVWTGTKWMIVMDIKGFFDNINHDVLIKILEKRIDDKRFIKLIESMLKAGYLEDWKYNKTYSGTPQGGVISPILANIYLNELDEFVDKLTNEFNSGEGRVRNPEHEKVVTRIQVLKKREKRVIGRLAKLDELNMELIKVKAERAEYLKNLGNNSKEWRHCYNRQRTLENQIEKIIREASDEEIVKMRNERKELELKKRTLPYGDPYDHNYKRLNYCRYADDFILGVIGSKEDAQDIKKKMDEFITNELKLEIEENKTAIVNAKKGVAFLGFIVQAYDKPVPVGCTINGCKTVMRSSGRIQLIIPNVKLNAFCEKHGYGNLFQHKPMTRAFLTCHSDAEIIETYNAELRGIVNYYGIGLNPHKKLEPLVSLARTSCAITLAHKHRTTTRKIITSMKRADGEWVREIETPNGVKQFKLYRLKTDDTMAPKANWNVDNIPNTSQFNLSHSDLLQRLDANTCEICGSTEKVEVHHIRALKDVKASKSLYDQMMVARQRKTLVLCSLCHHKLHNGKLPTSK